MDPKKITFIPGLFRPPSKDFQPVGADDPFISHEVLKEHCSLFASDGSGVPNYVREDPKVSEVINFTDEVWNDIAKVDLIFSKHSFFLKKQCPVMIPYKSTLNHAEHKAYLRAFVKFKIRAPITAAETAEYDQFLRLQHRVYEEQNCFMQFSHQVAKLQLATYNMVPEVIANYVNEHVQHRCKRAFKYKSTYIHEQQVPICPQDPMKRFNNLCFNHLGHLLSLGSLPWFKVPTCHNQNKLRQDESVSKLQPPRENERTDYQHLLYKTPVSEDPNVVYLAQKHQANIVTSTSALKTLADNYGPNFDKEWDIPVEVRSYTCKDVDGKESSHRVVFIDKPMPKKVWTPLEKKQLFYKKSALASLTEIRRFAYFRMKSPVVFRYEKLDTEGGDTTIGDDKEQAEYDDDFLDFTSTADHDIFGFDLNSSSKMSKTPKKGEIEQKEHCNKGKHIISTKENSTDLLAEESKEQKHPKRREKRLNKDISSSNDDIKSLKPKKNKALKTGQGTGSPGKSKTTSPLKKVVTCSNDKPQNVTLSKSEKSTSNMKPDPPPTNTINKPQDVRPSDSECGGVLESLLDMQDSFLKPTQVAGSPTKLEKKETSEFVSFQRPWSNTLHTDWQEHIQAKNCPVWSGINVHYQLFSLGFNSSQPNNSQALRIIVRHNLHGLSRFKSQKMTSKPYIVYPKPENQAYFGCEVNTLSEITEQWIQLLVRPNTTLLQVRVCETSGEILLTEERDLAAVLKEGKQPHIGFLPHQPLATMYSVFSAVSGLSTGHYILHHDLKTEAFIKLMKAADSDKQTHLQTFNLHASYSTATAYTRTYTTPPWLAIDTHVLTPFHLRHHKIPATFPMDNPTKKLTKAEKRRIKERAKSKKRLEELDKQKDDEAQELIKS
ncbi:little elongation complex subunit 2-like [Panulirus ornatus]|uniref:little elongation complex subunit 2-like n=1 Tax=Panulirus ornatus TaxID=150431 RepID=UPI003A83FF2F